MRPLKRIKYWTMNSWNRSTAPAYNLKVYNVIDSKLQDKVFELMECVDFYDDINYLMHDFGLQFDYKWQVGFNGRSGGYLVLYRGGCEYKTYTEKDFNSQGMCYMSDRYHWVSLEDAKKRSLLDRPLLTRVYSQPGQGIDIKEVPVEVLKTFRRLAVDIVKSVEYKAKHFTVEEETYTVEKTHKVCIEN